MKKLKTKGFSAVEGLVILMLVGVVGGVGWYIYQTKHKASSSADNESNSSTSSDQSNIITHNPTIDKVSVKERNLQPSPRTNNWLVYNGQSSQFSLHIPDGWKISTYMRFPDALTSWCGAPDNSAANTYNLDCITYKQGVKAIITDKAFPTEGFSYFSFTYQEGVKNFPEQSDSEKVLEKLITKAVTIYKTESNYQPYKEESRTLEGIKYYNYYIKKNDKFFLLHYAMKPGEINQLEIVEDMLATFQ
jgi:hypothetical protein